MKRTNPAILVVLAVVGGAIGWLIQLGLASSGRPVLITPISLSVALFGIAAIVIAVGWPVRQAVRGKRKDGIDPFRAMRVLVLAKASSLVGSLLGGANIGILLFLLSRPALPQGSSITAVVIAVVGSAAVLVAGLIVEHWCRIPPEDDAAPSETASLSSH